MKIKKFTILMTAFAMVCLSGQAALAVPPTATANTAAVTKDGGAAETDTGNVITDNDSGVDSDPDGDSLIVSLMNGGAASPVAGTYGSLAWTSATGAYTYTLQNVNSTFVFCLPCGMRSPFLWGAFLRLYQPNSHCNGLKDHCLTITRS